jgi:hypothetical protein
MWVAQTEEVLPERWARIGGDVYSPKGMYILAHRIIAHPGAAYSDLLTAPFRSSVFDDWEGADQIT